MGAYSRWALANKYGILQNAQRPKEDEWTLERLDFGIEWVKFHYKGKTKLEHGSFLFPCRSVNFRIILWILTYQQMKLNCCRRMTTRSFLEKFFTYPCDTEAPFTRQKIFARLGWKKYAYQKNWFGTDRFSRVNDFAPSVPGQNFTRARTMSRGSPSTDKIGTRSWKASPARIKCAV